MALLLILAAALPGASAHASDQSYLYLDIGESLTARLQMPFGDVSEHLGIEIAGTDDEIQASIEANEETLRQYAEAHFELTISVTAWVAAYANQGFGHWQ